MSRLHHTAAGHGIRHVFTGIGGDEMVAISRTEADAAPVGSDRGYMPWITALTRSVAEGADDANAPASRINEMTPIAAGCARRSSSRLARGPCTLADPRLITFGEWLPEHWRRGKHLHRERLTRRGLGPRIARPPLPEVLTGIMDQGLREHGADLGQHLACHGGHLIDSGYVDAARLAEACDRIASGAAQPRDREIFDVLALELAISALAGDPQPVC